MKHGNLFQEFKENEKQKAEKKTKQREKYNIRTAKDGISYETE